MTILDGRANFAYGVVAAPPSPAVSGLSLDLGAGQGALMPVAPFNATVWPAGAQALASNAEIVRATARATDTLTILRAREGTAARVIVAGDQIAAAVTRQFMDDISSIHEMRHPKLVSTMPTNQATQQSAANFFARVVWPETGVIDRIAAFCTAVSTSTTMELGAYDTSATTRNRLAVATGVTVAAGWCVGTVSLAVKAGDSADLAYATNNGAASFAGNTMNASGIALLPTGFVAVPLGGVPRLSYYISGITALAATYAESSFGGDAFCPLIIARYA